MCIQEKTQTRTTLCHNIHEQYSQMKQNEDNSNTTFINLHSLKPSQELQADKTRDHHFVKLSRLKKHKQITCIIIVAYTRDMEIPHNQVFKMKVV